LKCSAGFCRERGLKRGSTWPPSWGPKQNNISNIFYWPSFESFRWAGSNASDFYAADDGAAWHVSEDKVAGTIRAFVEMFSAT
jgi:hypothetical protein